MKVIHLVSGGDSGGARTHIHSLLQGLNKSITADLVCFRDGPFAQDARSLGLNVRVLPHKNIFSALAKLKRIIIDEKYDLIHCHGSRGNFMGACLKSMTGLPVVTTVHSDPNLDYMGRPLAQISYGTINRCSLRCIPYHIGVSNAMTDLLIQRGIARKGFYTLYNGVSFDVSPLQTDRIEYLRNLGVPVRDSSVVVGIAARLDPVKDIATLIRGFSEAHGHCPYLHLVIAGDGQEKSKLMALARELGMEHHITFVGWLNSNMDQFYSALDINVLSSLSETFPYSLTEGARHKLATIATNVGGIPDLIQNGVNGFLFTPGDYSELSRCLITLGNDIELRNLLGSRLYKIASEKFSLSQSVRTQLSIYEDICRNHAAKAAGRRRGAVLCGAYGQGNSGDDAILKAIIDELRGIDPHMPICVMTRQPVQTRLAHRVEAIFTFNYFSFRRRMKESVLYINGGGSLIQNVTSRRSLWFYLMTLSTAHKVGCKVMMYGCGIGPVNHKLDRKYAARIINDHVDTITLREPLSRDELRSLGVVDPEIIVAADPAVSLKFDKSAANDLLLRAGLEPLSDQRYLGITVRPWRGFEEKSQDIADSIESICLKHGLIPVFIPINPNSDLIAANHVAIHLKNTPHVIISGSYSPEEVIALYSRMDLVLSMRLHGLIFTAISAIPMVGIVYDPKVSSFLDSLGHPLYVALDELDKTRLCDLLECAANMQRSNSELQKRADKLRELEHNNTLYAEKLLSK